MAGESVWQMLQCWDATPKSHVLGIKRYKLTTSFIIVRGMSQCTRIVLLIGIMCLGLLLRLAGLYWGQGYQYAITGDQIRAYRVALSLDAGEERAFYIGQPKFKTGRLRGHCGRCFGWSALKSAVPPTRSA